MPPPTTRSALQPLIQYSYSVEHSVQGTLHHRNRPASWGTLEDSRVYTLQVPAIRALVALGCAVSVTDSVLSTPIHVAAGEGHNEAVLALRELVGPQPWYQRFQIACHNAAECVAEALPTGEPVQSAW